MKKVQKILSGSAAAVATACLAAQAQAQTAPTIPDVGVDMTALVPLALAALGAVVVLAVGGWVAFKVIRISLGWIAKAMRG